MFLLLFSFLCLFFPCLFLFIMFFSSFYSCLCSCFDSCSCFVIDLASKFQSYSDSFTHFRHFCSSCLFLDSVEGYVLSLVLVLVLVLVRITFNALSYSFSSSQNIEKCSFQVFAAKKYFGWKFFHLSWKL